MRVLEGADPAAWGARGKEYLPKTTDSHQMRAKDAPCFGVVGWNYYYLITVMDDYYSRLTLAYKLLRDMTSDSFIEVVRGGGQDWHGATMSLITQRLD